MYGCGREALPHILEWSGGPPGCPGVVGRPSRLSGSGRKSLTGGREAFVDVQEALPLSKGGRKALPDVREWSGSPT